MEGVTRALFVAGKASDQVWSELVVLPLAEGMRVDWEGREFVWVVLLTLTTDEGAQQWGQEWVKHLDEAFGVVTEPLAPEGFLEWWQGVTATVADQAAITAIQVKRDGGVVMAAYGKQQAVMGRGGQTGVVLQGETGRWQMAGGEWQAGDRWLLMNQRLIKAIDEEEIRQVLAEYRAEDGQSMLAMKLQQEQVRGAAGAMVILGEFEAEREMEKSEDSPAVYLKDRPRKRRRLMTLGILILIVIAVGVWWGGEQKLKREAEVEFKATITQVEQLMGQAQTPASLTVEKDLTQARELLVQAAVKVEDDEKKMETVKQYQDQVEKLWVTLSGEHQLGETGVWYDLSLVKEGFFGTQMAQTEEEMVILDGAAGMVINLGFDKKDASLTGSSQLLAGSTLIATGGERVGVYATNGVYELDTENKTTGVLVKQDSEWKRIVGLGLFAGNVYLLDAGVSDIYVYPGLAAGVGERRRWLSGGQTPDLTEAVDLAIDGDVWTIDGDGTIRRMRQGEQIDYKVTGLTDPIGKAAAIVALPESEQVYVLDQGKSRVVVLNKEGVYQKQYLWPGLAGASDLAVDEAGGGLMVLSGKEIYRLELK